MQYNYHRVCFLKLWFLLRPSMHFLFPVMHIGSFPGLIYIHLHKVNQFLVVTCDSCKKTSLSVQVNVKESYKTEIDFDVDVPKGLGFDCDLSSQTCHEGTCIYVAKIDQKLSHNHKWCFGF